MNIIGEVIGGVGETITNLVPSLGNGIVTTAKTLFLQGEAGSETGTVILGIITVCAGIALVTSLLRLSLRLLRIRKTA